MIVLLQIFLQTVSDHKKLFLLFFRMFAFARVVPSAVAIAAAAATTYGIKSKTSAQGGRWFSRAGDFSARP